MLTRAQMSIALITEGRCWDCEGPLVPVPDGWADCAHCHRRMRIADGVVHERVRPPAELLGMWIEWIDPNIIIVRDDTVTPMAVAESGRGYIPPDTRWLQTSWPVPDSTA